MPDLSPRLDLRSLLARAEAAAQTKRKANQQE